MLYPLRPLVGSLALLTGALVVLAAGCGPKQAARPAAKLVPSPPQGAYLGDQACAACHPSEFKDHRATRHAATMRAGSRRSLGEMAPSPGVIPRSGYTLIEREGRLLLASTGEDGKTLPLELAFGSGKTGMTFVAPQSGDRLVELRMSYFPSRKMWFTTPGQQAGMGMDNEPGRVFRGDLARRCVLCHATTIPAGSLRPDPKFYGVGCESCHGPGGAHVEAMRAGNLAKLHMERLGEGGATRLNQLCGKCHRTAKDIQPNTPDVSSTQRFQPYGLMRSLCFQKSSDALSCLTCHDPHTDSSTNQAQYEAACLRCHASDIGTKTAPVGTAASVCPVNPRSGCIPCHMPPKPLFPDTALPIQMADHFIRVHESLR